MAIKTVALGAWSARVQDGVLRRLTLGSEEVLRSVGPTVRDADWATIVPTSVDTERTGDAALACATRYRSSGLSVEVVTRYETSDDTLTISSAACMLRRTSAQRIGLSVLFPLTLIGRGWAATGDAGTRTGRFPDEISAVPVVTGIRTLAWELPDHGRATLQFEGSTWDVEDQRNWSDASYKGYSPSFTNAEPWKYEVGAILRSQLTLTVGARPRKASQPARRPSTSVSIDLTTSHHLPPVGCVFTGGTPEQLDRLVAMAPTFLRVPLDLMNAYWADDLDSALAVSRRAGAQLVIEALLSARDHGPTAALADALEGEKDRILDVLVFDSDDGSGAVTAVGQVNAMRTELRGRGISARVGGGTRANYRELVATPALETLEVISLAITPTVHALDDDTVMENLETLDLVTCSVRQLAPRALLDVVVSMRPRINPYLRFPYVAPDPSRFDRRVHSEFGAAWLIGVVDRMESAFPDRLTLLESAGSVGWVDGRHSFTSQVLGILAAGGSIHPSRGGDGVACVALRRDDRMSVLIATTRDEPTVVNVHAAGIVFDNVRLQPRSAAILSGTIPN